MSEHVRAGTNNPRFSQIPDWLIDEATPRGLQCYSVLASYASWRTGEAFPGRKAIAKRMKCTTPTVDTALDELEKLGAIHVESGKEEGRTNVYWVYFYKGNMVSQPEGGAKPVCQGVQSPLGTGYKAHLSQTITKEQEPTNELDAPVVAPKTVVSQRWLSGIREEWSGKVDDFDDEVAFAIRQPWYAKTKDQQGYVLGHLKGAAKRWAQRQSLPAQRNGYGSAPAGGEVPPLRFAMDSPQNASNRGNARPREVIS